MTIRAYEVVPFGEAQYAHVEHAESHGQARYLAWLHFRDVDDRIKLIDLRVRSLGAPRTSARLARVAEYRKRPELGRAGVRVCAGALLGEIVDADDACNFVVAFENGTRGHVHPGDIVLEGACDGHCGRRMQEKRALSALSSQPTSRLAPQQGTTP